MKKKQKQILKWAKEHGHLPSRKSVFTIERSLGLRLENYMAPASVIFDPKFRNRILKMFPERRAQRKRKHDVPARIKEVLEFLKKNKRAPHLSILAERHIVRSLRNLIHPASPVHNPKIAEMVEKLDPCYRTQVPYKFRKQINTSLDGKKLSPEKKFLKKK